MSRETRAQDLFASSQLFVSDFDNTVALTFEKSPNGIGVDEAYNMAITEMFGVQALEEYQGRGGLRNRAPIEVVGELAAPANDRELNDLTDELNEKRLGMLMKEIGVRFPDGSMWPRLTKGYVEFYDKMKNGGGSNQHVTDIILSSGHEQFIEKTYEVYGLDRPTHIFAEETARQLATEVSVDIAKLTKPSPILMMVMYNLWRQDHSIPALSIDAPIPFDDRDRIIYVGDDPKKDGELAEGSNVRFKLIDRVNSATSWQDVTLRLQLGQTALIGVGSE